VRVGGVLHALDLPAAVAPAVAGLWESRPLDPAAGSAVDDALRAVGARLFDGAAPARVDLVLPSAIVAGAPWEALVPRGVPVVRRAPGAVAHTRPARPPLRAAVAPDATLPDAILAAVFGTRDYTPLLVLRPWPSPRAEVVQLRALPELGEVATLYAALTSAGAQLLLVEAYASPARGWRRAAWRGRSWRRGFRRWLSSKIPACSPSCGRISQTAGRSSTASSGRIGRSGRAPPGARRSRGCAALPREARPARRRRVRRVRRAPVGAPLYRVRRAAHGPGGSARRSSRRFPVPSSSARSTSRITHVVAASTGTFTTR